MTPSSLLPTTSSRPGMGATPHADGVSFRVWAPNAESVAVTGAFLDWAEPGEALASEENGYWSGDVPAARVGDEYKFRLEARGEVFWRADPYARSMAGSAGNSIVEAPDFDWGDDAFQLPPRSELVVYELHLSTFGAGETGAYGDLGAAIERLGYLRELGVNCIELLPLAEARGRDSWGYAPAHLFALETDYGRPRDLKRFVRAAHALGIGVLLDVVYNHLGPYDLDLWRFDGWFEKAGGGIYFYNDERAWTPWGHTRPDYGRQEVRQFLRDNALYWLSEFRLDGLRWDATAYIRSIAGDGAASAIPEGWGLMRWVNDEVATHAPGKLMIAEDLLAEPAMVQATTRGGAGFDAQWDARFVHPVRAALTAAADEARDLEGLRWALSARDWADPHSRVLYTESHDEVAREKVRVPEAIWPGNASSWASKKRSTLGAVLVFTTPGIPMLFQGQEFLEDEGFHANDRLDWSKRELFAGILQLYRDLIALRLDRRGTTAGLKGPHISVHHVNDRDKVLAFHRWASGGALDDVVVVVNLSRDGFAHYELGFPRGGSWRVRFNSDWTGYDAGFGDHPSFDTIADRGPRDGMGFRGTLGLGPYSALVLSQDPA